MFLVSFKAIVDCGPFLSEQFSFKFILVGLKEKGDEYWKAEYMYEAIVIYCLEKVAASLFATSNCY